MNTVTPEKVGLSSTRLSRIHAVMQEHVNQGQYAGIITMVARRGQIAHFECFGMMDVESARPMRPDTIFRIYSMSKPITSVAVMMLYEEGHFQLHTPVSEFIPKFKETKVFAGGTESDIELADLEREITIHDLLTHTSGLIYGPDTGMPVDALYKQGLDKLGKETTLEKMVQVLATLPLIHQPGSAWRYSFSTDVLGRVVEVVSGTSFDAFLAQRIFDPLQMGDTGFYVPPEKLDRFATLYGPEEGKDQLKLLDDPATGEYSKPPAFLSGGGGLVSTAHDYMRFAQMLLNKGELDGVRLLGRKTIELMTVNHLPAELLPYGPGPDPIYGHGFGLGWKVMMDTTQAKALGSEGMYGWGGAASTEFWVDPKEELIGLIMLQFMPYYPLVEDFQVLVYQALVD
jgi:CubicO group peptidase (beta-lactamase class C family)